MGNLKAEFVLSTEMIIQELVMQSKLVGGQLDKMKEIVGKYDELLNEGLEHMIWCSGSEDFGSAGKAKIGWDKGPQKWIDKVYNITHINKELNIAIDNQSLVRKNGHEEEKKTTKSKHPIKFIERIYKLLFKSDN